MTEQAAAAALVGEFEVVSTSVVWVEGVIPVTHARLERLSGPAEPVADPTGRIVAEVSCGSLAPKKAFPVRAQMGSSGDGDRAVEGAGRAADPELLPGFVESDDPEALGLPWVAAVAALSACRGVR